MDAEKIIQDLNRRFSQPLPEFYRRRIIFWYDPDREFEDQLEDIVLDNAQLVALTGTNTFAVKKLLCEDDTSSNFLVYDPRSFARDDDNWLINVQLYSEEFRADMNSIWMDEMGLPATPIIRNQVKNYWKFFRAKDRREAVKKLNQNITTAPQMHLAVMSAICGNNDLNPNHVIKAVLRAGLEIDENSIYQTFLTYGADKPFWSMVAQGTGYSAGDDPTLGGLAVHLLLTAATKTMHPDNLAGLNEYISTPHASFCYDFVSDWLHSEETDDICAIAEYVETELGLPQRFVRLHVADMVDTEIFPCVDEVILVKLMRKIDDNVIDEDTITQTVEKRRTCVWYDGYKTYYEGILHLAKMQAFYKVHADGFHTVEPDKVWKEYTTEYYRMDTYYRMFHKCYADSLKNYHEVLSDLFARVMDKVEGLYVTWFLGQLGNNWSDACADQLRDYGHVLEIPQQTEFYSRRVSSIDSKAFVIISDAMRYEVAASLAEQLRRETQAKVSLESMQGVFPTITKFGMAALLPHEKLSVELKTGKTERLAVLADGQSTEAPNRDKLLKGKDPLSVALKYKDIIGMKRADRQDLIKGMNVVYIYHDTIDEAGHMESSIFTACDTAIDEIKNMVRIIANEWRGANILITSDHGFLYTHSPLTEDDKVDKTTESEQDVEIGRRYAIMQNGAEPQYLMPVKFLDGETGYDAFAPRESIRIKMKGGGLNFVHGGVSLQELVVPVIEYHFLRNQSKEYKRNKSKYDTKPVEISLLSASRKICNMIFSLSFYQKDAVGGNREAATYQLYFTDSSGKQISDIQKIIADKTSDNGQERTFRATFNLKSLQYNSTDSYYLVIADENGLQVQREEFQIDIAFAVEDFNFFS